jgi:prevent-host-death family protein
MTKIVNIHEAKTHLSRLLEEVTAGSEVVIARAGMPVARLVPIANAAKKKRLGLLKGKIKIGADFNEPLPEAVLRSFES